MSPVAVASRPSVDASYPTVVAGRTGFPSTHRLRQAVRKVVDSTVVPAYPSTAVRNVAPLAHIARVLRGAPAESSRGQSLVEFVLVVPILFVLFVGIADFGRIFNAGVVIEAAARDAAEHAAQMYLANPPGDPALTPAQRLSSTVPSPDPSFYASIRDEAGRVACAESRQLPNTDYSSGTCATWPAVGVCVHDSADPDCGAAPSGFASPPPECGDLNAPWPDPTPGNGERWVEVRLCYKFTSLLRLPLYSLGDFYVQRTRTFTIPCYFATGYGGCP